MTEGQVAAEVARLVAADTGRGAAIDGNYVSKLERGKITWPNSAYRRAFREIFEAETDAELGFYAMRTRRDAELWLSATEVEAEVAVGQAAMAQTAMATHPPPETQQQAAVSVSTSGAVAADKPPRETRETVPRRTTSSSGSRLTFRLHGIRWAPVLLASLAITLGWLAYSTVMGQNAASAAHHRYQAGGLRLAVDEMTWISKGKTSPGQGKAPIASLPIAPGKPGAQSTGNKRLHLEVDLENVTSSTQNYDADDFRVIGPGGQSWQCAKIGESPALTRGRLQPGYKVTLDVYFDIPVNHDVGLSIEWSRGGKKVDFPVNTSAALVAPM